jgi:uracil-DNA glycosylase family 4
MVTTEKMKLIKRLNNELRHCRKCPGLNVQSITENAPGYGNLNSKVMLIGQSLCYKCMESQIPFTGGSGIFLDRVFEGLGILKSQLFITNVVHCHTPRNRPSKTSEIENCHHFLEKEIEIIQPRLIVALGKDATQWFLGKVRLGDVLYRQALWNNVLIYPTYHPSFIKKRGDEATRHFVSSLAKVIGQWM